MFQTRDGREAKRQKLRDFAAAAAAADARRHAPQRAHTGGVKHPGVVYGALQEDQDVLHEGFEPPAAAVYNPHFCEVRCLLRSCRQCNSGLRSRWSAFLALGQLNKYKDALKKEVEAAALIADRKVTRRDELSRTLAHYASCVESSNAEMDRFEKIAARIAAGTDCEFETGGLPDETSKRADELFERFAGFMGALCAKHHSCFDSAPRGESKHVGEEVEFSPELPVRGTVLFFLAARKEFAVLYEDGDCEECSGGELDLKV